MEAMAAHSEISASGKTVKTLHSASKDYIQSGNN